MRKKLNLRSSVMPEEDEINILNASIEAMRLTIENLTPLLHYPCRWQSFQTLFGYPTQMCNQRDARYLHMLPLCCLKTEG